jgi:UDP-N-acetyl-D-galactosamine dehydrogenase
VHDPVADAAEARHEYGISLTAWDDLPRGADAIVAAVAHRDYLELPIDSIRPLLKAGGVFADVKSAFKPADIEQAGYTLWRL